MMYAQRNVDIDAWIREQMALESQQPTDPEFVENLKREHQHALTYRDFMQICLAVDGVSRLLIPASAAFGRDVFQEFQEVKGLDSVKSTDEGSGSTEAKSDSFQTKGNDDRKVGLIARGIIAPVDPPTGNADVGQLAKYLEQAWQEALKSLRRPSDSNANSKDSSGTAGDSAPSTQPKAKRSVGLILYVKRGEISFAEKLRRLQLAFDTFRAQFTSSSEIVPYFQALIVAQTDPEANWPYTMTDTTGIIHDSPVTSAMLSVPDATLLETTLKKAPSAFYAPATLFVRRSVPYCPICVGDCEIGDQAITLPCGHQLHAECLEPWLAKQHSCPLCRHPLPRAKRPSPTMAELRAPLPDADSATIMYT